MTYFIKLQLASSVSEKESLKLQIHLPLMTSSMPGVYSNQPQEMHCNFSDFFLVILTWNVKVKDIKRDLLHGLGDPIKISVRIYHTFNSVDIIAFDMVFIYL